MNAPPPPLLIYHKVTTAWEVGVTAVTPRAFASQMRALRACGWVTVLPGPAGTRMTESAPALLPPNEFILAFDDGYECVYENAFPLLQSLNFPAMVFMPSGFIGRENDWDHQLLGRKHRHLDLAMLRELTAAGWMVGSHGIGHVCLTALTDSELHRELAESKASLEQGLGAAVNWCAFPFGRYDSRVLVAALTAGYSGAVVPVLRRFAAPNGIHVWRGNAIYIWDSSDAVTGIVSGAVNHGIRHFIGRQVNFLSGGTILWRRIFQSVDDRRT